MKFDLLRSLGPGTQMMFVIVIAFITTMLMTFTAFLVIRPIWHVDIFSDAETIQEFNDVASLHIFKVMMIFNQIGMFLLPALVFKTLFSGDEKPFFVLQKKQSIPVWVSAALLFIVAFPLINYLHWINLQIPYSDNMSADDQEATAKVLKLLSEEGMQAFLANIFVYAFIPAICEEFFFRGIMLRQIALSTKNIHLAVWISAALFSFIHGDPSLFIPRFLMGVSLGYIFVWSGSIWISFAAHFINNIAGVSFFHALNNGSINEGTESLGMYEGDTIFVLVSVLLTGLIVYLSYKNRNHSYRNFMMDYYREENIRRMKNDEEDFTE